MSRILSPKESRTISRPPTKPRAGQLGRKIYFILCQATGRVKVGVAADPFGRLADLQVGSPTVLKLIAQIEGDSLKERLIHQRLERWHIRGEWFHYAQEVVDIIGEEVVAHLKNLHKNLYAERSKLGGYLSPQCALFTDTTDAEIRM